MKKLKLDLDDLQVDSFDTTPDGPKTDEGTVFGYSLPTYEYTCVSCNGTCGQATCQTCAYTCISCGGTCVVTCQDTCAITCGATCVGQVTCFNTCGASCLLCTDGATCFPHC